MNLDELAKREMAKHGDARERNRREFPLATADLDMLRTSFPNARIVYAEENGRTIGKRECNGVSYGANAREGACGPAWARLASTDAIRAMRPENRPTRSLGGHRGIVP